MPSKLNLVQVHIGYGKRGMIKTDQDLDAISPFTFKKHFSKDMKKAYRNWTLHETFTGSIVSPICGNVLRIELETGTGTSRKIRNIEDSVTGDGLFSSTVLRADETNILFLSCFGSKGYSGWFFYSTSRTLNRKTKEIVLDKISALGFKLNRAMLVPY